MSIVNQMSAETPPLKLCDEPFVDFLGFREEMQHGEIQYFMDFRDSHIGNPMIGTFHGGILASFGEVAAAGEGLGSRAELDDRCAQAGILDRGHGREPRARIPP